MSSAAQTLCLFSVALCNIGSLDQNLFNQQPQQQNNGFGGQNGNNNQFNGNGYNQFNQQQPNQNKPRPPHQTPCPARFRYVTDGNEWKGIIKIFNFDLTRDNVIEADFALPQRNVSLMSSSKMNKKIFKNLSLESKRKSTS